MPKGHEKEVSKTIQSTQNDVLRDSRDVSNILTILDNQVIKTNPFGANVTGENSYRRAERISAALHLITNHISETEPLRGEIRTGGLHLLSLILELRAGFRTPSSEKGQTVLASIRQLVSFVRLLAVSGFVSAQNVTVVAEALDELGTLIVASQKSTLAEQMTISRDDLVPRAHEIEIVRSDGRARSKIPRRVQRTVKDITDKLDTGEAEAARSNQVMDILRVGGILGIKDISANLPQYSEKMIQRELANLVRSNQVRKMGAKRWSKYQIAVQ